MRKAISLFSLLFFAFNFFAQEHHDSDKINGHVFELLANDSLSPLPGVNVYYLNSTSGTSTDKNGYFELEHDHSNHTLIFSFIGYSPDTLHLKHDEEINVVMSDGKLLEDLVVEYKKGAYTFSKIDPRHAHIIGQDELRKAACCNLAESFETNPSIDATFTDAVTGTKQIQMMGLSGKYVQMLSSNVPVIRGLSTLYGLRQIPGAFIHQIAVSKGAGSVLNGYESMAGQINMNLKQPENAEKFHLNLYLNQAGRSEYNAFFSSQVSKKWATTFSAHYEDQSRKNDRNNDGFLDTPLRNDYIVYNQWNYRSRKIHMELGVNGVISQMESGRFDAATSYPVKIDNKQGNAFAKIGYLFPKDNFKSLALQLSTTYNEQNSTIGLSDYDGHQYSAYANLIYQQEVGKKQEENYFKLGASCQLDSVNEKLLLSYATGNNNYFRFNWLEVVPGVFGEFTHNTEKWGLIAGIRGDYSSFYNNYFVTPRLHLRHNFNNETALKLMAGSGRRTPFMIMENMGYMATARTWNFDRSGLIGLGQEYSWNVGFAMLREFTLFNREGTITLDAYHTFFENQLVVDLDESARQINFYSLNGESYSNSIQAEFNYDITRKLSLRTAYRFLDVKTTYESKGLLDKPFVSRHRGFINLAYNSRKTNHKQWKTDLTAQWIGSQRIPYTGDNIAPYILEERSPDYVLLNAQITRIASKSTEFYLGVENGLNYRQTNPILSYENPQGSYFDSSMIWGPIFGRMIYAGLRYTINQDKE